MSRALIGHTGFVGGTLFRARSFTHLFNTSNFRELAGQRFDEIVCAGIPAVKYIANREPEQDWRQISALLSVLERTRAGRFVLISTIDVYPDPSQPLNEDAALEGLPNQPYGRHRLAVERFVAERFPRHAIVRLPALFGEGLKKNALFDLLHDNMVEKINPAAMFQWYPMHRLAGDLERIAGADLRLVNLVTEPVPMREVIARHFPHAPVGPEVLPAPRYNLRTRRAALFGGAGEYVMAAQQVMEVMGAYIAQARQS